MSLLRTLFTLALIGSALAGCTSVSQTPPPSEDTFGTVSGTVTYYEKIAMPADAVLNLKIVDPLYSSDEKPMWIAEKNITPLTQVPISFEIQYKKADINPDHTYAIQARLFFGNELRFKNNSTYKVITQGNPSSNVNIVMQMVSTFLLNTVVDVKLVNASQKDSSKAISGEQAIVNPTEWPIPFKVDYDPAVIDRNSAYVLQASITVGNTVHFLNNSAYPVLTQGGTNDYVEVTVEPIAPLPIKTASVTGTVTYHQEIALTPDAVVVVELIDVSEPNPAGTTIGKQTITKSGPVPVSFDV
ncbi:YbaY family lipoprotein, partial [Candidatus Acetothermia bacterium]|nr:YbaY family lipoprotein [Candidatus Acetothermia bacterium]